MSIPEKSEIESFLNEFKLKMETFDIFFLRRDKNEQTLFDLEITPRQRIEFLRKLKVEDYFRGPISDNYDPASLPFWEFGIKIKRERSVYKNIFMEK